MSETKKTETVHFGLTWLQKGIYLAVLLALTLLVAPLSPMFTGALGIVFLLVFGILLGGAAWFSSAAWTYKVDLTNHAVQIRDASREMIAPYDKIGLVLQNGGWPLPAIWLVLRSAGGEHGMEIPKRADAHTREALEAFVRRNPGKKVTVIPIPGAYLRSRREFVAELQRRIPPLAIDERLGGK